MKPRIKRAEAGGTLVMVVVFIFALMGFAALSVDLGNAYTQRRYMQEAADAAAIAAVPDWAQGQTAGAVTTVGKVFALTNGLKLAEISVTPGAWNAKDKTFTPNESTFGVNAVPAVQVTAHRRVATPFWGAMTLGDQTSMSPQVESVAVAARATTAARILPWAACSDLGMPTKCTVITIQNGDSCSGSGNFGALNLTPGGGHGGGGSTYQANIESGYAGTVRVGDTFYTEPGKMTGPTSSGLQNRVGGLPPYICTPQSASPSNKRLAIVPITTDLGDGSSPVTIVGFWTVALGNPNGGQVDVAFIEVFSGTEVDPSAPPVVGVLNGIALVK